MENVICNAPQSEKRSKREEENKDRKDPEDEVDFAKFYDNLDFVLNPDLKYAYE